MLRKNVAEVTSATFFSRDAAAGRGMPGGGTSGRLAVPRGVAA